MIYTQQKLRDLRFAGLLTAICTISAPAFAAPPASTALPSGESVVSGNVTFTKTGGANPTEIITASDRSIVNYSGGFNVGSNASVNIVQPSTKATTLGRDISGNVSQIFGSLKSNGTFFLVNGQGVVFGVGSQVNVGGLVATTSDIDNNDFIAGKYNFSKPGNPNASIVNNGNITVADGGLAALVGPNVDNNGYIQANLGKVQLAGADTFTVDLYGDGLINLQASPQLSKEIVRNSGSIQANGGQVLMTTAAATGVVNSLINMDGVIQADSVGSQNGKVVLYAQGSGSTTNVSGTISAQGKKRHQTGGTVEVLANNVTIKSGAVINASGKAGGGALRIGGDFHGAAGTPTALTTTIEQGAFLNADATRNGNGGTVAVWSDGTTNFAGTISAKGGKNGGNGGFVETSGHVLNVSGLVYAGAERGIGGSWLLDPTNITIDTVAAASYVTSLNSGTNVNVTAVGSITDDAAIAKTAGGDATLTMNAGTDIVINSGKDITSTAGKLNVNLNANTAGGGGSVQTSANISTNGGNIALSGVGSGTGGTKNPNGVFISSTSTLDAQGGNITITGTGQTVTSSGAISNASGVQINGAVKTSGAGTINIAGTGGNTNGSSGNNYGVYFFGGTVSNSGSGSTTVTGIGGGTNASNSSNDVGVEINTGGIVSTGSGTINVTGTAGGKVGGTNANEYGIETFSATSAIGGASATGAVTLTANSYNVRGGLLAQTSNSATLLPLTAGTTIGVNGGAGTLQVTSGLISAITSSALKIGSTSGTAALTANAGTWNKDVSFLNGSGDININGFQTMGNHKFLAETATTGNIVIAPFSGVTSTSTGDAIILAAGGNFTNNGGASLSANNGRWLVYSASPTNDTFGGLDSGNTAIWGTTYPTAISATGNRYVFAQTGGTLTVTANDISKVYGLDYTTNSLLTSDSYTVTGGSAGVAGAFLGDSNAITGTITFSSLGAAATAGVNGGTPYAITGSGATSSNGSSIVYAGNLTVTPASLTITANNQNMTYGDGNSLTAGVSTSGLVNGDSVNSATLGTNATTSSTSGQWNAGSWTITASGATGTGLSNYTISYVDGALNIAQKGLDIAAVTETKVYDGTTLSSQTPTASGLVSGDTVTAGQEFLSKNVFGTDISVLGITPGYSVNDGNSGNNYAVTLHTAQGTITPAALTISAVSDTKVYDGTTTSSLAPTANTLGSDTVTASQSFVSQHVLGTNGSTLQVNGGYIVNDGNSGNNYTVTLATALGTINPATVTLIGSKVYDANKTFAANTFGTIGGVNGETLNLTGNGSVANANVSAGTQALTLGTLHLTNGTGLASDYKIATSGNFGTITPASITLSGSKVYDTTGDFAANSFGINGTIFTGIGLQTLTLSGTGTTASPNVSAGTQALNTGSLALNSTSGFFGGQASNYQISTSSTGTITPATLTLAGTKVYDGNTTFVGANFGSVNGLNGQTLTVTGSSSVLSSNVSAGNQLLLGNGSLALADGTNGGLGSNYQIAFLGSTGKITPATLTYVADPVTQTYGTAIPSLTGSVTGFIAGQNVGNATNGTLAFNTNATQNSNVGSYYINGSGLTAKNGNYVFVQAAGNATAFTINPAVITLTGSKVYDSNKTFAANTFGTINGVLGETLVLTGNGSVASANVIAGPQALNLGTLHLNNGTGLASNYVIAGTGNTGTITPATITLSGTKVYDTTGNFAANNFGINGTIFTGIGLQTLTLSGSGSTASPNVSAGTQALNTGSLALNSTSGFFGGLASNYQIAATGNTGKITPATLVLNGTKVYDGNKIFTGADFGSVNGLNGQTLTVTGSSTVFSSNVSAGKQFLLGNGSLALADGTNGGLGSNYQIALIGSTGKITPATLTVTANDKSMVYGDSTLPTLTDTITGYVAGQTYGVTSGVTGSAALSTTATAYNGTAGSGSNAGNYVITAAPGTLAASNYTFQYVNGTLTVTPASLTITADAKTKVYGSADPTLTYAVSGLQNGDTANLVLAGGLNRDPGEHVAGGPYAINQGTLAANGNYTVTYNGDFLTITPASLSVVADNKTKGLGTVNPTLTYTFGPLQNGDTSSVFTGGLTTTALLDSLPGIYPINQGSLSAGSDYAINYTAGALTVESPLATLNSALLRALLRGNGKNIVGTLLSILNGNPAGGLANLAPAAGGNGPIDLANLSPSAGGPNAGIGGNVTALIQCDENSPCGLAQ